MCYEYRAKKGQKENRAKKTCQIDVDSDDVDHHSGDIDHPVLI
jgi:hypothetical protein